MIQDFFRSEIISPTYFWWSYVFLLIVFWWRVKRHIEYLPVRKLKHDIKASPLRPHRADKQERFVRPVIWILVTLVVAWMMHYWGKILGLYAVSNSILEYVFQLLVFYGVWLFFAKKVKKMLYIYVPILLLFVFFAVDTQYLGWETRGHIIGVDSVLTNYDETLRPKWDSIKGETKDYLKEKRDERGH